MSGPLPAVAKAVRVDFHFSEAADPNMQIRLFFQYSGTLSSSDASTWLANMIGSLATFMTANMSNQLHLVLSELTDLTSNTAPQVQDTTAHAGGSASALGSASLAMVMRYHILRRYRGGHPRTYLPGIPTANLASATSWDPTALSNVTAAWTTFLTACTTGQPSAIGTITHVNISYFSGFTNHTYPSGRVKPIPNQRVTPLVDTIVGVGGNPTPASQRRRNEQP